MRNFFLFIGLMAICGSQNFASAAEVRRKSADAPKQPAANSSSRLKVNKQSVAPGVVTGAAEMERYFSQFSSEDVITIGTATGYNNLQAKRATEQKKGNVSNWKISPNNCWVRLSNMVYAAEAKAKKGEKKPSEGGAIGDGSVEVQARPIYFSIQQKLNPTQHLIFLSADDWQDQSNDCPRPSYLAVNSQELYKLMQAAEKSLDKQDADKARANKRDLAESARKITGLLNGQLQKRDPSTSTAASQRGCHRL
jgi:hypothetical protein